MTMKRFALFALIVLLFALLIAPALAQDVTPTLDLATVAPTLEATLEVTPPPVAPPVVDVTELPNYFVVLGGLVVLGVLLIFGATLYVVYNSIPAWAQAGLNAAIIEGVRIGKDAAAKTPTTIDDAIIEEIADRVSKLIDKPVEVAGE
jgi:hypothetical protein